MWIYFGKLWGKKLLRWSNIGSQVQPDHSKRWKWSDCFCSPSAVLFLLAFFLPLCLISRNTTSAHCLRRYITKSKQQFRPPWPVRGGVNFFCFTFVHQIQHWYYWADALFSFKSVSNCDQKNPNKIKKFLTITIHSQLSIWTTPPVLFYSPSAVCVFWPLTTDQTWPKCTVNIYFSTNRRLLQATPLG